MSKALTIKPVDQSIFDIATAKNLKQILAKDLNKTSTVKAKTKDISYLFKHKKKISIDPFRGFMKSGSKMMKRLATSQTSRHNNRRNTSALIITDNFDELDQK